MTRFQFWCWRIGEALRAGCPAAVALMVLTTRGAADNHAAQRAIIDMHCHIAGIGAGGSGCFVSPSMQSSFRYRVFLRAFGVRTQDLQRDGDQIVVQRLAEDLAKSKRVAQAVVLALDGVVGPDGELDRSRTEVYVPNEYVREQCARHTNLLFGASINPHRKDAIERLSFEASHGARLVKWLPNIQLIDPADPRLIPFYHKLRDLRIPLLVHTGPEHSFTISRDELGDPDRLRLPLEEGVTVIAAHAASQGRTQNHPNMNRLFALAERFPNLYIDISAMTQINRAGHLRKVLKHDGVRERLVYGTDTPLIRTPLVCPWYSLFTLGPKKVIALIREKNPWDRDVLYKKALGVPDEVFFRFSQLLSHSGRDPVPGENP